MKLNVGVPHNTNIAAMTQEWEHRLGPAEIERMARLADELGFHKICCCEHFGIPREHVELSGAHYLQPVTTLSYIASLAPRLQLSSSVTILPLQHPIAQAKAWSVLDWLSGGRAHLMIGVGWLEAEYETMGVDFHRRGRLCDEYVAAMVELWTKDYASFDGETVRFEDLAMEPKPVQRPHVPLWFGGDAPAMLRRVARWGTGWAPRATSPREFPAKLDYIRSQPDYHGRPIELAANLVALTMTEDHAARQAEHSFDLTNAGQLVDQLGWLEGLGVTEVSTGIPQVADFEAYLDWLRWLAAEVMPKIA